VNAERLHAVVRAIRDDLRKTKALQLFQQLRDALQNQVNQPQQPAHQQQVSESLRQLDQVLGEATINAFTPAWKQALSEIGVLDLFGERLRDSIREIFARNQITPSVALQEIIEIAKRLEQVSSSIDQLIAGLAVLQIGAEELEPGECELGVLVPRNAVQNRLGEFAKELATLNKMLGIFEELATGTRSGFPIRSISSSDLTVFLDLAPQVAACMAVAVERIVALYKQLLEIRGLRKQLSDQGVPAKALQGVDSHANGHMKKGIDVVAKEMIEQYAADTEEGRRNELQTELHTALNQIANRIDKGYNIDVRVRAIEEPEGDAEEDGTAPTREALAIALEASKRLQFLKPSGDPILSLPEPKGNEDPGPDEKT